MSRDSDYGVASGQTAVLNDWLTAEFKKRVGTRRKVILTNKLTVALKKLDEVVTKADEEAEQQVIGASPTTLLDPFHLYTANTPPVDADVLNTYLKNLYIRGLKIPLKDTGEES